MPDRHDLMRAISAQTPDVTVTEAPESAATFTLLAREELIRRYEVRYQGLAEPYAVAISCYREGGATLFAFRIAHDRPSSLTEREGFVSESDALLAAQVATRYLREKGRPEVKAFEADPVAGIRRLGLGHLLDQRSPS